MSKKRILQKILLILIIFLYLHGCQNQINKSVLVSDNSLVLLKMQDGTEFFCFYKDLFKITQHSVEKNNIGKSERDSLIRQEKLVSGLQFKTIYDSNSVFIVNNHLNNQQFHEILKKYLESSNLLLFRKIPENDKGDFLKKLWLENRIVTFKEYHGDFYILEVK